MHGEGPSTSAFQHSWMSLDQCKSLETTIDISIHVK